MRKQLLDGFFKTTLTLLVVSTTAFSLRGFGSWLEALCDRAWVLEPVTRALAAVVGLWDWRAL